MIAHLDLDAFYAAVEQLERPELRGVPLVVGGDPRGRGVVMTASYEARAFGIGSAMSCAEALRRCPSAVFVRSDFDRYRAHSRAVWDEVRRHVDTVEQVGIDEGYLELGPGGAEDELRRRLRDLQDRVRAATGLTCSLGAGRTKTVAKIASDREKPAGLVVVPEGREAAFLAPLPLRLLPGVGPRADARFASYGLRCIGELAQLDDARLAWIAPGRNGVALRERARGADASAVRAEPREPVSIGHETTFDRDIDDERALVAQIPPLAASLAARLERRGIEARSLTVKLRYADFSRVSRTVTVPTPIEGAGTICELAGVLVGRALADRADAVRLLGLTAGRLEHPRARDLQLALPLDGSAPA